MRPPRGRPEEGWLRLGGAECRGSSSACADLDGRKARRVPQMAARCVKGAAQ